MGKRGFALGVGIVVLGWSPSVEAQMHWKAIARTPDNTYTYIDSGSIVREKGRVGFRVLEVSPRVRRDGSLLNTGWYQVVCSQRKIEILSLKFYAPDNTEMADFPNLDLRHRAEPGTVFGEIFNYACPSGIQ